MHTKKIVSKNVTEICIFVAFFDNFFNGLKISVKFCIF
jgi:hypothetical protein